MVQSCRESAQTLTKYIAAPTKQSKEHPVLLEAILSQEVNSKENFFFFSSALPKKRSKTFVWTMMQISKLYKLYPSAVALITSRVEEWLDKNCLKQGTLPCMEREAELGVVSLARLSARDWNQLWGLEPLQHCSENVNSTLTFRETFPRTPPTSFDVHYGAWATDGGHIIPEKQ